MIRTIQLARGKGKRFLRTKAATCKGTAITVDTIRDLRDTLRAFPNAIGLAAPQIGVSIRAFVLGLPGDPLIQAYINPTITEKSDRGECREEGCLSYPGTSVMVCRPLTIMLEYTDEGGKARTEKASGLRARAIQHEIDHLDGILIVDREMKVK